MIDMETWYWIFGAVIVMFNVISIGFVMLGNTDEQNDGRKLFISSWVTILLSALAVYLVINIVIPVMTMLLQAVWYPF